MSNYTVQTNFGAKDELASGNAAKVIRGADFTVEFNNIATAIATKADTTSITPSLDIAADVGNAVSINLNTETFSILGGNGIRTVSSANQVEVSVDASVVATLINTQTLINKTLTSPVITALSATGGLTVDTDKLVVATATSRVGVNVADPTTTLDVGGTINCTALTVGGDISVGDDNKILVGEGDDLQIYHDGDDSYIEDTGTGDLNITAATNLKFLKEGTNKLFAKFIADAGAALYCDGAVLLETRASDTLFYGNGISSFAMAHPSPSVPDSKLSLGGDTTWSQTDATLLKSTNSLNIVAKGDSVNIGTDAAQYAQVSVYDTYVQIAPKIKATTMESFDGFSELLLGVDNTAFGGSEGTSLIAENDLNLIAGVDNKIQFGEDGNTTKMAVLNTADGSFGIGEDAPDTRLHVKQDNQSENSAIVTIENTSSHATHKRARLNFVDPDSSSGGASIESNGNSIRISSENDKVVDFGYSNSQRGMILHEHTGSATGSATILCGSVYPNNNVTASAGSLYLFLGGGVGATLWIKESGQNTNTGWVGK
jgi:hypothetical protein